MVKLPGRFVRLLGAVLVALAICGQAAASSKYVLIAEPPIVHPGDTIYLSGGGYPPNTQLTINSVCDDGAQDPKNHIAVAAAGPTTNGRGQLIGAPFQPPSLPDMGLECKYYPAFGTQDSLPVVPAMQLIDPSTRTIDSYNRVPFIYFWPKQSHGKWTVLLESWPGSRLHLKVRYFPSLKLQRVNRTLGWQGKMTITAPKNAFKGTGDPRAVWVLGTSTFRGLQGSTSVCQKLKVNTGVSNGICG